MASTPAPVAAPASEVEERPSVRPVPITGPAVPTKLRIGDSNPLEVVTRGEGVVSTRQMPFDPPPAPAPPARRSDEAELPDLRRVAQSARLKAEACARASHGESTAGLREQIRAVREGETDFDGGLWMCSWLDTEGRALASRAEPCYRALAAAGELGAFLRERDQLHPGLGLEEPFQLMARAQSMVRNFVDDSRGDDLDQLDMFHWLRALTSAQRCRVLVGRYMRRSDIAPPDDAPATLAGLETVHAAWKLRLDGAKERRRLLGKVRHKAGLLAGTTGAEALTIWNDLERVMSDLASQGVRATDPELASALAEAPQLPEGFAPSEVLAGALRRAQDVAHQRTQDTDDDQADPDSTQQSPEAAAVSRLLSGRVVLLIGGEVKPVRRDAIERAFGLRELRWIGANMNDSSTNLFEPQLRRPETALVIRMVRFTRTNHGEILDLCKRYGRPFVNLPGGYSVNQLASQILMQAGDQLRALPPVTPLSAAV